ncbi:flagellar basal body-associated protein FliL [Salimicrobium jeotgali]|uniref:Flagellar protein FliL n=1 Tax=Salimicrobium jeotgali TaxID=1230341 RepID=K2GCQ4_9BACI|nr:flagellar basal body-associated protein FliL [Salimicrobium jeotgali]AKG04568.1 flagellar basal body-associated protein FliL [Salimicrobium jeotgali]EKE32783.1 flagellar basal body-associated protein FliL [Salimicrobium jeotgali]MBM7695229.1 flagellar FliL protein [Salimicrobium jeotgali]
MSKLMKTTLIILSVLTVLGVGAIVLVLNMNDTKADGERSIDDIRNASLETEEMTTDLKDGGFVRISFRIVTDSKDSLKELEKRDFQMKNVILKQLARMKEEDFKADLTTLEDSISSKLNEVMKKGKVTKVYTISKVLQ